MKWSEIRNRARASGRTYLATRNYPNRELMELLYSASEVTEKPPEVLLEELGRAMVPALVKLFRNLIEPGWRTLDVLEHAEERVHRAVRARDPIASPPPLEARRWGPDEVVITYSSPLKLCSLAKGLIKGFAEHFGEQILVAEGLCMNKGAEHCELSAKAEGKDLRDYDEGELEDMWERAKAAERDG